MASSSDSDSLPLRVAVYLADQNPHRDRSQGITNMTLCLLHELHKHDNIELMPVVSKSSVIDAAVNGRNVRVPWRTDRTLGRLVCDAFHPWMPRLAPDVWYYPKGYVSLLARSKTPTIGTMHDVIVQHYADHYPAARSKRELRYWLHVTERSLRRLDVVLTVSEHAKEQLLGFCRLRGIPAPDIQVTYESSDCERYVDRQLTKGDYVVHLASTAPHKQTLRLLQLWQSLQERRTDLPELQLIGSLSPEALRISKGMQHVVRLPHLDRESLVEKLSGARALLFPSEIEGFGLPALEAYLVGTPVCFVSNTAVAEIVHMGGCDFGAFELQDVDSFSAALDSVLNAPIETVTNIRRKLHVTFSSQTVAASIARQIRRAVGR